MILVIPGLFRDHLKKNLKIENMSDSWILIYAMLINYITFTLSCILMCYDKKREDLWMKTAVVTLLSMIITSIIGVILV